MTTHEARKRNLSTMEPVEWIRIDNPAKRKKHNATAELVLLDGTVESPHVASTMTFVYKKGKIYRYPFITEALKSIGRKSCGHFIRKLGQDKYYRFSTGEVLFTGNPPESIGIDFSIT